MEPGTLVLFLRQEEPWPAIVCDDGLGFEFLPHSPRPNSDAVLIMTTAKNQLHWALPNDCAEFPMEVYIEMQKLPNSNNERFRAFEAAVDSIGNHSFCSRKLFEERDQEVALKIGKQEQDFPSANLEDSNLGTPSAIAGPSSRTATPKSKSQARNNNATKTERLQDYDLELNGGYVSLHQTLKKRKRSITPTPPQTSDEEEALDLYDIAKRFDDKSLTLSTSPGTNISSFNHVSSSSRSADDLLLRIAFGDDDNKLTVVEVPPHRGSERTFPSLSWESSDDFHYRFRDIPVEYFNQAREFLETGDYHPHLLDAETDSPRLQGGPFSSAMCQQLMEESGCAWLFAVKLHLYALQRLVLAKLSLLEPFTTLGISLLVQLLGRAGVSDYASYDEDIRTIIASAIVSKDATSEKIEDDSLQKLVEDDVDLSTKIANMREANELQGPVEISSDEESVEESDEDGE
ncbi:MAG: hypothetical protein M1820_003144 [Bogoriella megaspora]|nr:MAG: hypothetical protein M1820_003144 [Bogoriella megaspora]